MSLINSKTFTPFYGLFESGVNSGAGVSSREFPIAFREISSNGFQVISPYEIKINNSGSYQVKLTVSCLATSNTIFILQYFLNGQWIEFDRNVTPNLRFAEFYYLTINTAQQSSFKVRATVTGGNILTSVRSVIDADTWVRDVFSIRRI